MDLLKSSEVLSLMMPNALGPGNVMPIHLHCTSSETVVVLCK